MTRITHSTATLIDNVFVSNQLYRDFELAIILNDMSDHMPLLTLLKQTKFTNKTSLEFKSRNLNEKNVQLIKSKLYEVDWISTLNKGSCKENFNTFAEKVNAVMDTVSSEENSVDLTQMKIC